MRPSVCFLSVLPFLVFTAVYAAAVKGQNEEFLRFLNDALNMNVPPESPHPEVLPVSESLNPFRLPDPVCSVAGPLDHSNEISKVTPEPSSVEFKDTADKSGEDSESDDRTDANYRDSNKKKSPTDPVKLSPDNNSADSNSAEETYTAAYANVVTKKPSKVKDPVVEDISSEEMERPVDFKKTQEKKRMIDVARGSEEHGLTGNQESFMQDNEAANNKDNIDNMVIKQATDSVLVNDSTDQDCTEVSSKTSEYPNRQNTRTGGPDNDLQSEEGITNYESQLRRKCAIRKRLRAPSPSREQLDTDSVERVNSELIDRDNSNERIDAGMPPLTL